MERETAIVLIIFMCVNAVVGLIEDLKIHMSLKEWRK